MRRARLARPVFATVPEYGARLGDTGFWAPYVAEVLARHGLPAAPLEVGAVGTMPTFLVGRYVVKLFGELFSGGTGFEVERLVHADLHADHIFVAGADLVGVIDWGDALVADAYYELPAMHLDAFGWSKPLLAAFLEGYGWQVTADFARRAMSMTLLHQFDVLRGVSQTVDLNAVRTLDELADFLWGRTTPGVVSTVDAVRPER